ncbi:MAG: saccharopine dehydrogenase NADP-binding domain-containing protein [Anaerolineae bacterium]|nr:MAG: saccharopine dehydrogenase NADP-binding domain-containing protein [Anaerolineae bacterium]
MKIVVLGGAGLMGRIAVKDLAASKGVDRVVIADRDTEMANRVADLISAGRSKISVVHTDVTNHNALVAALRGADAVINAVHYYFNLDVMRACLEAGTHYTDLGGLFHNTRKQLALHDAFVEAGLTAVLGMGSAPGVTNVQARYTADRLDTITSIRIYDGILPPPGDDIRFGYAIPTIIDELVMPPVVFLDGQFVKETPLAGDEDYWFTSPVGLLRCHYSLHSEVATLPVTFKAKGIRECFFKINYWGMSPEAFTKVKLLADLGFAGSEPVDVRGTPVRPRDLLVTLLADYIPPLDAFVQQPADPYRWTKEIVTEVRGTSEGRELLYRLGTLTASGSLPTGVAPSVAAQWLASGRIPGPGVFPPEAAIDPLSFFEELAGRGIVTQVTATETLAA